MGGHHPGEVGGRLLVLGGHAPARCRGPGGWPSCPGGGSAERRTTAHRPISTSSQPQPVKPSSKATASNTSRRTSRLEVKTCFSGVPGALGRGAQSLFSAMARCSAWSGRRGLIQGEAAEGHRHVVGRDGGPAGQEVLGIGQHVAVQEQQVPTPGVGGQAVAALGAALVRRQHEQARGQLQLLDPAGHAPGQGVVAAAVVQQHDLGLDTALVQGREQGAGIVAIGGDQHRQARLGPILVQGGPGRIVDQRLGGGLGHAAFKRRWRMSVTRPRRPPASSASTARP